jgi:hypothetical protein
MFFQVLIGAALALTATANLVIKEQQPVLSDGLEGQEVDLIKEFVIFLFLSQWQDFLRNEPVF